MSVPGVTSGGQRFINPPLTGPVLKSESVKVPRASLGADSTVKTSFNNQPVNNGLINSPLHNTPQDPKDPISVPHDIKANTTIPPLPYSIITLGQTDADYENAVKILHALTDVNHALNVNRVLAEGVNKLAVSGDFNRLDKKGQLNVIGSTIGRSVVNQIDTQNAIKNLHNTLDSIKELRDAHGDQVKLHILRRHLDQAINSPNNLDEVIDNLEKVFKSLENRLLGPEN